MQFKIIPFKDLTNNELYDLLQVRVDVFVVEQDCPYPELDNKDKLCMHYIGIIENKVMATARIVPKGVSYEELSIGRVAIHKDYRGMDFGKQMMQDIILYMENKWPGEAIRISAQSHLEQFYNEFGFLPTGKCYLEDGIPHMEMLLEK